MPHRPPTFRPPQAVPGPSPRPIDTRRPNSYRRGYDRAWRKFRIGYLALHPFCSALDCNSIATDLDHITPMSDGGPKYDDDNLQPLCHSCHSRKTIKETPPHG